MNREENRSNLESRGPVVYSCSSAICMASNGSRLTLEHIEADSPELVNVRMEDLGKESNLGRCHRIVVGKEEFELENAACIHLSAVLAFMIWLLGANPHMVTGSGRGSRHRNNAGCPREEWR